MIIPEHAKVSHADGCHQGADHLVELARSGPEYSSESGVTHVQKRLYPCLLAGNLVLLRIRLFRCQARTRPLTITYQRTESMLAKHAVPSSQRYRSRIHPQIESAIGRWGQTFHAVSNSISQAFITTNEAACQSREARDPVIFEHA